MTMDERQWSKARNLASAYGEAYDEDVAAVLGEALLEVLAELLVPEEDREVEAETQCGSTSLDGHECSRHDGHAGLHGDDNGFRFSTLTEPFVSAEAIQRDKARHPAFVADRDAVPDEDGSVRWSSVPQFLEGESAYEAAPVGTLVRERETTPVWQHTGAGGWRSPSRTHDVTQSPAPWVKRAVLRWGNAS